MNGKFMILNSEYLRSFIIKLCALYIMEQFGAHIGNNKKSVCKLYDNKTKNVFKEINYCK